MIHLFSPVAALGAIAAGGQILGGIQDSRATTADAKARIVQIKHEIGDVNTTAARQSRDEGEITKREASLAIARAVAGGASRADTGIRLMLQDVFTESEIRKARIEEDRGTTTRSLLDLSGSISKSAKKQSKNQLLGGALGGLTSLLSITN